MKRIIIAAVALAAGTFVVAAQGGDPIAARKDGMKSTGQQTGLGTRMVRGTVPFDLAQARAIFATYEKVAGSYGDLFPQGSESGGETAAAPAIWSNRADFDARIAKWAADARAEGAKVSDLASFQAAFAQVTKNCGTCHETYRLRRN